MNAVKTETEVETFLRRYEMFLKVMLGKRYVKNVFVVEKILINDHALLKMTQKCPFQGL